MNKLLLGALGVAAVALLVWALMPAAQSPVDAPAVAPQAPATAGGAKAPATDPPVAAGKPAAPPRAAKPIVAEKAAAPKPRLAPPKLAAPLVPMPEGEVRPPEQARYGRKPDQPLPRVDPGDFKASVRRYYGNLPRSGRMPGRITVEEVFPPAVYEGLNIPPRSQLVEIGHYPATGPEGLTEALEIPDDSMSTFGFTVVTPDGQRIRDYVQLTDEPEPTP